MPLRLRVKGSYLKHHEVLLRFDVEDDTHLTSPLENERRRDLVACAPLLCQPVKENVRSAWNEFSGTRRGNVDGRNGSIGYKSGCIIRGHTDQAVCGTLIHNDDEAFCRSASGRESERVINGECARPILMSANGRREKKPGNEIS